MNGTSSNRFDIDISPDEMDAAELGYKVFNDSVHGHIALHPLLVRVVDTPEFQRLRNIKQLGVAYYVFPAAGHCRFEHCLGWLFSTCYLAGLMVDRLTSKHGRDERLSLCVQLAGLCHDLGHGPFSHTWELVAARWGHDWKHEPASVSLFDYLLEKNQLLGEFRNYGLNEFHINVIKELIMGGPAEGNQPILPPEQNFLYEIVANKNNGIDVDKWDYFLRDGLHLNLRTTFDYRRLLEFCTVLRSADDGRTHVAFRDKEVINLYDMYRVRSALFHQAYRHRVVVNIELMLIDALKLAGDAGYKINNSDVYLKKAHLNPETFSSMTDHLFYDILYSKEPKLKESQNLLRRILSRQLYRFVGKINVNPFRNGNALKVRDYIVRSKNQLLVKLQQAMPHLSFEVADFHLDICSVNDPITRVKFYQKVKGQNKIVEQSLTNIRDIMDVFPFHLTNETCAVLYVFCKSDIDESDIEKAQEIIESVSDTVPQRLSN